MKHIRFSPALALCCCLLLSGCGGGAPASSRNAGASAASSSGGLTEEDVLAAYREAAEAYDWFDLCSMPVSGGAVTVDGCSYQSAAQAGITTFAQLRAHLASLFSDEIVEKLLVGTPPPYRDINGRLCVLGAGRGSDINLLDKTVTAEQTDENHWTVTLTFYADSYDVDPSAAVIGWSRETLDYENTAAGWRFTSFCSSDGLNEDADTVFTFNYTDDKDFSAGNYRSWSPLKLACWLLHADGAYAEGPGDTLTQRLLDDPDGWFGALSVFPGSPWKNAQAVLSVPAYDAAAGWGWFTAGQTARFQSILATYQPKNKGEQTLLDGLKSAQEYAMHLAEESRVTPEQEFSLAPLRSSTADFPENQPFPQSLQLGIQDGAYPWGCDGLTGNPKAVEGSDYGQGYEVVSGNLTLHYFESDSVDYLTAMTTADSSPATSLWTRRGTRCGDTQADLLTHYASDELVWLDADHIPAPCSTVTNYDGAWVFEQSVGCKHIAFYMKDDAVVCIELEDLMDGQLLPH